MPPTNEAQLVGAIKRALLAAYPDAWIFKVVGSPYQTGGVPDLLVLTDGHFLGLEVKFPRSGESREHALARVTPVQQAQIDKIKRAGGFAAVVTSVEEALDAVDEAWSL